MGDQGNLFHSSLGEIVRVQVKRERDGARNGHLSEPVFTLAMTRWQAHPIIGVQV